MTTFLIRSFDTANGYTEMNFPGGSLPRTREESYVPWGITAGGRVVYAKTGEHTGWRGNNTGMRPYDTEVSRNRRRLCQAELGLIALNEPSYTRQALDEVSNAILCYLKAQPLEKAKQCVFSQIGHYFFTGGSEAFGRISLQKKDQVGVDQVWSKIIETLASGTVDQKMGLYEAIARKVLPDLGGGAGQMKTYQETGAVLPKWLNNPKLRGRKKADAPVVATDAGGIASGGVGTTHQSRNRGVDIWQRDPSRTRDDAGDFYYDNADSHNLLFGAAISGTTGQLFKAGIAFAPITGEKRKQYTMAIVGYLGGGGMHSYHEIMAIASLFGVPYNPGAYETSLPASFTTSHEFRAWRAKYYDIVVLGATHWLHNMPSVPSHLNTLLKSA